MNSLEGTIPTPQNLEGEISTPQSLEGDISMQIGLTPDIQIGSVEVVNNDSEVSVELDKSSTKQRPVLNFKIPKGAKGDAGSVKIIFVTELPTENIEEDAIYAVPNLNATEEDNNKYNEFIYTNGDWEPFGGGGITANLDDYVTNEVLNKTILETQNGSMQYYDLKTILNGKTTLHNGVEDEQAGYDVLKEIYDKTVESGYSPNIIVNYLCNGGGLCTLYTSFRKYWDVEAYCIIYSDVFGGSTVGGVKHYGFAKLTIKYNETNDYYSIGFTTKDKTNLEIDETPILYTKAKTTSGVYNSADLKVLAVGNETEFTPTGDYNPATKKYVDDNIVAIPIPKGFTEISSDGTVVNMWELEDGAYFIPKGGKYKLGPSNQENKVSNGEYFYKQNGYYFSFKIYGASYVYFSFGSVSDFGWGTQTGTILYSDMLNRSNTIAYTPTGDYNPTPKKYVDESILASSAGQIKVYNLVPEVDFVKDYKQQLTETGIAKVNEMIELHNQGYIILLMANELYNNTWVDNTLFKSTYTNSNNINFMNLYNPESINVQSFYRNNEKTESVTSNSLYRYSITLGYTGKGENSYTHSQTLVQWQPSEMSLVSYDKDTKNWENKVFGALTVGNTKEYIPTEPYHPATKDYVDTQVGDISTILSTLTTVEEVSE